MKRVLVSVVVLLLLLPVLLVGVLILAQVKLDLTPYRDTVSRWASTALDRKVGLVANTTEKGGQFWTFPPDYDTRIIELLKQSRPGADGPPSPEPGR